MRQCHVVSNTNPSKDSVIFVSFLSFYARAWMISFLQRDHCHNLVCVCHLIRFPEPKQLENKRKTREINALGKANRGNDKTNK